MELSAFKLLLIMFEEL